jgi:endo-1,4-beta-xylanase
VTALRGNIFAWDVINEPLNEDGTLEQNIWTSAIGPDYIPQALQWAHDADPGARLYINDFNLEAPGPKSDAMYALVKSLQSQGVPIHGVGFQGHLDVRFPYPQGMPANLQRFVDLGLDVAVTEADVRMPLPATPDKLATQAQYFSQLLADYLTVSRPVSFTMWGFTDAHSWVDGFFIGEGAACILDANYQPKPAYFAMRKVLTG